MVLTFLELIRLLINDNQPFGLGIEVGLRTVMLISHPQPTHLAALGLGSHHVGQDDHGIVLALGFVDELGGSIEARPAIHHPFPLTLLILFPSVNVAFTNRAIEGNDIELDKVSQLVQFSVERNEHRVTHRTTLVDADRNPRLTSHPLASVNVGEALVQSLDCGPLVSLDGCLAEP